MLKTIYVMALTMTLAATVQVNVTVPSSLLARADGPVVDFATALSRASVPAGLELRESDDGPPASRPDFRVDPENRVPLTQIIEIFEAQHPDYHAARRQGVIVIRPREGALPFLDQPSDIKSPITVTGLMAAMRRVFSALDPGLMGPIINSGGRPSDALPVVLDGSGARKVVDTLNQIAAQAPGRTWVVTTRPEGDTVRVVSFGIIEPDGSRRKQGLVAN